MSKIIVSKKLYVYKGALLSGAVNRPASEKQSLSTHVLIPCSKRYRLARPSVVLAEQATAIDKSRLVERRGHIKDHGIMANVTEVLQIQIGAAPSVQTCP